MSRETCILLCALTGVICAALGVGLTVTAYWFMRPGLARDAARVNERKDPSDVS